MRSIEICLSLVSFFATLLFCAGIIYLSRDSVVEQIIPLKNDSGKISSDELKPQLETNKNTSTNILFLGGDKVNANTDTMMLININPDKKSVNVLSIPRDTKVTILGRTRKINYAWPKGGKELVTKTVEELLMTKIDYYVYINTSVFREVIDTLGGIDYYVPKNMYYADPAQNLYIGLKKGWHVMDGKKAEQFVRYRNYIDGDIKRISNQQDFLKEVLRQRITPSNISGINKAITNVFENTKTNLPIQEVIKLTTMVDSLNEDAVRFHMLPGEISIGKAWYYICDQEAAIKLINDYFKRE